MDETLQNILIWLTLLNLTEQANRDYLTGLYNRRYFEDAFSDHLRIAARYHRPLSIVMLDLDDFRELNRGGHARGDEALCGFATLLRKTIREADIACRYGGDEFALLLPETSAEDAYRLLQRLTEALARKKELNFTFSAGVSEWPESELLARADTRLLEEKKLRSKRG